MYIIFTDPHIMVFCLFINNGSKIEQWWEYDGLDATTECTIM